MTNILNKPIVCTGICCLTAVAATGCGMELEPPDTLEGVLHAPSVSQETTTTPQPSAADVVIAEDTTEYQSIFFQPAEETSMPDDTDIAVEQSGTASVSEMGTSSGIMTGSTGTSAQETAYLSTTWTDTLTDAPDRIPDNMTGSTTTPVSQSTTETVTEAGTPRPGGQENAGNSGNTVQWEQAYRIFLEQGDYETQFPENGNKQDVKFMLLYFNDDTVPELFIQTATSIYFYTCRDGWVYFIDSVPVSHFSYNFYYRPYQYCICTSQGSVLADGSYLDVWEYEASDTARSGIALKAEYCYPAREYSYEVYSEMGKNIDFSKAPEQDIHMERSQNLGSSWFIIPDVLEADINISRYTITEENLDAVFGEREDLAAQETQETQKAGGLYAIG